MFNIRKANLLSWGGLKAMTCYIYGELKAIVGDSRAAADYAIWRRGRLSSQAPTPDRRALLGSFCSSNDYGYHYQSSTPLPRSGRVSETTENSAAMFKPSGGL